MHEVLHMVVPTPQEHTPAEQTPPRPQLFPHTPQLLASSLMHQLLHATAPEVHEQLTDTVDTSPETVPKPPFTLQI